jgi:hypothetical protein
MLQRKSCTKRFLVGLVLAGLLVACGDQGEQPAVELPPAQIELGAGRVDFIPVQNGDSIELVSGPQGGYHLEFTLRLFDVDPEGLVLDYQVHERSSAKRLSIQARYIIGKGYVLDRGDHFLRVGDRAILDVKSPMEARGLEVDASCRIERAGAVLAEDNKRLSIIDEINELGF